MTTLEEAFGQVQQQYASLAFSKKAPTRRRTPWPHFPESAWYGLVADYRVLVGPTTEAPDVFHYAAFMTTTGALLGRRVHVHYGNPIYPNFYSLGLGPTGQARKTTAHRRASGLVTDAGGSFVEIPGLGSAEGFLEMFPPSDGVMLLVLDEFTHALAKMEQKATATLEPALLKLYDCMPHYQFPTRERPIEFRDPFFAILAATTPERFADHLREAHLYSGFMNRFSIFAGGPKAPLPFPPKPDQELRNRLVQRLHEVWEWAQAGIEMQVSAEALALWERFYCDEHYARKLSDAAIQMTERIPDHIWKHALLYAAQDKQRVIDAPTLSRALDVGRYLMKTAILIAGEVAASEDARTERKMVRVLNERGLVRERDLHQALSGRVTAERFHRILNGLVAVGIATRDESGLVSLSAGFDSELLTVDTLTSLTPVPPEPDGHAPDGENANVVNTVNASTVNNLSEERNGQAALSTVSTVNIDEPLQPIQVKCRKCGGWLNLDGECGACLVPF